VVVEAIPFYKGRTIQRRGVVVDDPAGNLAPVKGLPHLIPGIVRGRSKHRARTAAGNQQRWPHALGLQPACRWQSRLHEYNRRRSHFAATRWKCCRSWAMMVGFGSLLGGMLSMSRCLVSLALLVVLSVWGRGACFGAEPDRNAAAAEKVTQFDT